MIPNGETLFDWRLKFIWNFHESKSTTKQPLSQLKQLEQVSLTYSSRISTGLQGYIKSPANYVSRYKMETVRPWFYVFLVHLEFSKELLSNELRQLHQSCRMDILILLNGQNFYFEYEDEKCMIWMHGPYA